jgi:nitrite reductase/ring-hydroxylating ferredoxin subunit
VTNAARPVAGTRLLATAAVPDDAGIVVDFAVGDSRWSVIVARDGDRFVAYENRCPHAGMPLDRPDGAVTIDLRGFLVCAAHLASFRLWDGGYAGGPKGPGSRGLTPVAVAEHDGQVILAE